MDSLKTVTKFVTVSSGILEWEIEDVSLQFEECDYLWDGYKTSLNMNSAEMDLTAGDGRLSKWHFSVYSPFDHTPKTMWIKLHFDGLFSSGALSMLTGESLNYKYSAVMTISASESVKILQSFEGRECTKTRSRSIDFQPIQIEQLKRDWPHGNLKISVEISHLSDVVKKVYKIANQQFLDLLDLKDALPVPVPSCYGNLMNNPDMSDFKIICEGSSFQAHKFILSVRSRVFRTMIESGLSESVRNELKIEDMTVKTVELMLEFIYKGTVEIFPDDLKTRIELLDCAEKYELDELKSICMKKIFSSLPAEKDVGELAMAAFTYGANERASKVIKDFCTTNHAKLIQNPEYKKLFLANPQAFMN